MHRWARILLNVCHQLSLQNKCSTPASHPQLANHFSIYLQISTRLIFNSISPFTLNHFLNLSMSTRSHKVIDARLVSRILLHTNILEKTLFFRLHSKFRSRSPFVFPPISFGHCINKPSDTADTMTSNWWCAHVKAINSSVARNFQRLCKDGKGNGKPYPIRRSYLLRKNAKQHRVNALQNTAQTVVCWVYVGMILIVEFERQTMEKCVWAASHSKSGLLNKLKHICSCVWVYFPKTFDFVILWECMSIDFELRCGIFKWCLGGRF